MAGCVSVDSWDVRAGRGPGDHVVPHLTEEETEVLRSCKVMELLTGKAGFQLKSNLLILGAVFYNLQHPSILDTILASSFMLRHDASI